MSNEIAEINLSDLELVTGGENMFARTWRYATTAARVGGRVAGKVVPALRVANAGYQGYQGYTRGREHGHSVLRSLGDGVQEVASDVTFGLIPHVK